MNTQVFQTKAYELLWNTFGKGQVRREFKISSGASDVFANLKQYLPKIDIAVGPFNLTQDRIENTGKISQYKEHPLVKALIARAREQNETEPFLNPNPRCLIAIEIEFSGSPKLVMGDFTNASMMGLVGLVISPSHNMEVKRRVEGVARYMKVLRKLEKAPNVLFTNVASMTSEEFFELPFS